MIVSIFASNTGTDFFPTIITELTWLPFVFGPIFDEEKGSIIQKHERKIVKQATVIVKLNLDQLDIDSKM